MNTTFDTYDESGIAELVRSAGQPAFRASQLVEWVYGRGAESFDAMTNLPKGLRADLEVRAPLVPLSTIHRAVSSDGTRKYLFGLHDGATIEAVGIPDTGERGRLTVCISSQVGCAMRCAFCATGTRGFTRNLSCGEMVMQVVAVAKDFDRRASNVVVMGQGEPFLNFDSLAGALDIINDDRGPGIGARHITVSTCGIPDGIRRFAELGEQYVLAVSLHSALTRTRDRLMPGCANIGISALHDAIAEYNAVSGRRASLEYLLIDGTNTDDAHFRALVGFCEDLNVHVNLLELNRVPDSPFPATPAGLARSWCADLGAVGIDASTRLSRGSDIDGACGQLQSRVDRD